MNKINYTINNNKAITLVALIITITVMLILIGVTINTIVDSDIIDTTEETVDLTNNKVQTQQNRVNELIDIYDSLEDI